MGANPFLRQIPPDYTSGLPGVIGYESDRVVAKVAGVQFFERTRVDFSTVCYSFEV